MKKLVISLFLIISSICSYSQCPSCPIGSTIISIPTVLTNITISSGTVTCLIGSGTYSGTITLNGGTLYVGNSVTYNPSLQNFNNTNIINNCGTLSKVFNSSNLTINNYTNNVSISYIIDNGVSFNNYATGVTLNVNSGNANNSVNITNSTNSSITVVTNTTNTNCSSSLGNSTNIINNGDMTFPNSLCMKSGLITNNKNLTFSNQFAMDGGTLESKSGSNTSINIIRKNAGSINVYDKSILSMSSIINFDGNSIKMIDSGCSYVTLSTPPSSSFNSNLIDNGPNVYPNGINYCGGVPRNSAASGNTISSVVNSFGVYRITLTNGNNAPNTGDYVYITGVVGGTLNGYWKVNKISNYVYDLINSSYTSITSLSSNFIYTNNLKFGNGTYMSESGCSNPCVTLPIIFTYFNIDNNDDNTVFYYGIDISYIKCVIQSSLDGKNFIDLYTSTNGSNLTYIGNTSNLTTYYRVQCIDNNFNVYYSQLIVNDYTNINFVEFYPNPTFDGSINIEWKHSGTVINSNVTLEIIDIKGDIYKTINLDDYTENNFILTDLPKGIYMFNFYENFIYKKFKIISL